MICNIEWNAVCTTEHETECYTEWKEIEFKMQSGEYRMKNAECEMRDAILENQHNVSKIQEWRIHSVGNGIVSVIIWIALQNA